MWSSGEVVRRREVLNDGRCWLDVPVFVVQDDDVLVTSIARGAAFTFPPGRWPGTTGRTSLMRANSPSLLSMRRSALRCEESGP